MKWAAGVRVYPLAAVAEVRVASAGRHGRPTLIVVPRAGCDLLRQLLKDTRPSAEADPDTLLLAPGSMVAAAEAFATTVQARLTASADSGQTEALVDTGILPLVAVGVDTRAVFDGTTVTLEVTSPKASLDKVRTYSRRIPVSAVVDVELAHPGRTGTLRFVLAGAGAQQARVDLRADLDTVQLIPDAGQVYAVLAAAVLGAVRRRRTMAEAPNGEREPTASVVPTPVPPTSTAVPTPPQPRATASAGHSPTSIPRELADMPMTPPVMPGSYPAVDRSAAPPPLPIDLGGTDPSAESTQTSAAPLAETRPSWRERRAEKRSAKEHEKAVADWQAEQELLDRVAGVARDAARGGAGALVGAGIILKNSEAPLWAGTGALIEPRRQPGRYVGSYSGVSFRVAPGLRYSVGGSRGRYVPGPEVQTPVDSGRVAITSQRVTFLGSRTTREWVFSKLVGVDASKDGKTLLIHVSNRQKVSGLHFKKVTDDFVTFLALGVAIAQHGPAAIASECEQTAAAHRSQRP